MKLKPLQPELKEVIHEHNNLLLEACNTALAKLRTLPRDKRTPLVEGQIQYWRNARGCLRWSNAIANQRITTHGREPRKQVQFLPGNTRDGRGETGSETSNPGGTGGGDI